MSKALASYAFAARLLCLAVAFTLSLATIATTGCGGAGTIKGIVQTTPTITWSTPAAITAGTALSAAQLDAQASVGGQYVYTPVAGTVMSTAGTQTLSVSFTPTDTTDYNSVTANVTLTVNPATPTITSFTIAGSRYAVEDNVSNTFLPYSITGPDFEPGDDILVTTALSTASATLPTAATTLSGIVNFNALDYEPQFVTAVDQRGSVNSNSSSAGFLGSASQSTEECLPAGVCYEVEQKGGQVYIRATNGTTKTLFPSVQAPAARIITVDDVTTDIVYVNTSGGAVISVVDNNANLLCYIKPGVASLSSVAAKGGYLTAVDSVDNLIEIASLKGCTGGVEISFQQVSIPGQPWAVAMANNGTELDAYIVSRDKASANGLPMLTKVNVVTGVTEGKVELPSTTPISTIRATTPYQGIFQVQASSLTNTAAVHFMSDSTDGIVLTISTDTTNGKAMTITHSVAVPELPIGIAMQDSATDPIVWVAYILANSGEAVTHIGAIDSMTGNYTPGIGECQAGILAGGFVANSNGVYCAMGSTIEPPIVLQP